MIEARARPVALAGETVDTVEDCDVRAAGAGVRAPLACGDSVVMVASMTVEHERERALAASERLNASIIEASRRR